MQWTIRDIPTELDSQVRELAKVQGVSLNKTVIQVLKKAIHGSGEGGKKRDLTKFLERAQKINSERDLKAMDAVWKGFEKIDPEDWR